MLPRNALLGLLGLVLLPLPACNGCKGDKGQGATATASASAARAKKKPPQRDGGPLPAADPGRWLRNLPASKIQVKPGDRVWAMAPLPGVTTVSFGVMEIESVQTDGTVTTAPLVRADGKLKRDDTAKRPGTPGALLTPAAPVDPAKIKAGDLVIASIPGFRTTVAQVTKVAAKAVEVKYVNGDKVVDETVEYVAPLAQGAAPFALSAFKGRPFHQQVFVAAVIDDQAYGVDELGNGVRADKADVKPLTIELKDRKPGDVVVMFKETRALDAKIETEIVPKWIYGGKFHGEVKPFPFYAIVDKI